jgi:cytochrome c-type biogenesis protein
MDINIGLAFLGGLASFLSPCVISMMPIYIGYMGGRSFIQTGSQNEKSFRWQILLHGFGFIIGFSLVFIAFGMTISILGEYLVSIRWWLIRLTGIVIFIFGLHLTGIVNIAWLDYEMRIQPAVKNQNNLATSFLLGVVFAAGWTPCIGPILGSILALTMQSGSIYNGFLYLVIYSLGLSIPFIVACFSLEWISIFVREQKKISRIIQKIMGILLILMGVMMFLGLYDLIVLNFANFRMG